jgi:NAD+ synthase (glutamine-hydrolysing)
VKDALLDIVGTPVSPELLPADEKGEIAQKTEDLVGPYELHDFFIYNFVVNGFAPKKIELLAHLAFKDNYSEEEISHWLKVFIRRFFTQQYKRSAVPDGPKVTAVSLSPRGSWMMPSDAYSTEWLRDIE